jgi:hypothetical protein
VPGDGLCKGGAVSCSLHESTDLPDPKVVQVGDGMFA